MKKITVVKLCDLLYQGIYNHEKNNYEQPVLIITNPRTWSNMVCEARYSLSHLNESNLIFRGIRVIRSMDIPEGTFEIL